MESPLLVKSKQFALDIIKVCNKVKSEKRESESCIVKVDTSKSE